MDKQHTQVQWQVILVTLLVVMTLGISGCDNKPPDVKIVVAPNISKLKVGETLSLSADATGEELKYQWKLTGEGKLSAPTTGPAVVYEATKPGNVIVTVEVKNKNGQMTTRSYNFVVESSGTPTPITTPTLPQATQAPTLQPAVDITQPVDTIDCPGSGACLFSVEGTSSNVENNRDLRIYVLVFPVNPPGAGWYPQVSLPIVKQDGTWSMTPAWLGSDQYPAKSGDTLKIVALVVHKDVKWESIKLNEWPPGKAIPTYQDIDYLAKSAIIDLQVK